MNEISPSLMYILSDNDVEKCGKTIKKMIVCIMDLKKKHDVKYIMGNSVAENRVRQRSDSGESADESGSNEHFLIKK